MAKVPGLRSPYARVGRLVYLGRMFDKIRLHARGTLPAEYTPNLGEPRPQLFDARTCRFLGVGYDSIRARTLQGGADEEILTWIESQGVPRDDELCHIWNDFMMKLGWRDDRSDVVRQRIIEFGLPDDIQSNFELLDRDEGRDPISERAWLPRMVNAIIVMGVSGCGKSEVGSALAASLGWDFLDGDDFHPVSNVEKMRSGHPLNDTDRAPWLKTLHEKLVQQDKAGRGTVLACSALKEAYRQILMPDLARLRYVHLFGDRKILERRLTNRPGHFMPASLLDSQFATLERPLYALEVDLAPSIEEQCAFIRRTLRL